MSDKTSSRTNSFRTLTWLFYVKAGLSLLACLVVFLFIFRVGMMSSIGHSFTKKQLEALSIRGQEIEISGLSGDLLQRIHITEVNIKDQEGIWLTASNVNLRWHPLQLVSKNIALDLIAADQLTIRRKPVLEKPQDKNKPRRATNYRIALENFDIKRIELEQDLIGQAAVFSSAGRMTIAQQEGLIQFQAVPEKVDGDQADIEIEWAHKKPLGVNIAISGPPDGILAKMLAAEETIKLTVSTTQKDTRNAVLIAGHVGAREVVDIKGFLSRENASLDGSLHIEAIPVLKPLGQYLGKTIKITSEKLDDGRLYTSIITADGVINLTSPVKKEAILPSLSDTQYSLNFKNITPEAKAFKVRQAIIKGTLNHNQNIWRTSPHIELQGIEMGNISLGALAADIEAQMVPSEDILMISSGITTSEFSTGSANIDLLTGDTQTLSVKGHYHLAKKQVTVETSKLQTLAGSFTLSGIAAAQDSLLDLQGSYQVKPSAKSAYSLLSSTKADWTAQRAQDQGITLSLNGVLTPTQDNVLLSGPWTDSDVKYSLNGKYINQDILIDKLDIKGQGLGITADAKFMEGKRYASTLAVLAGGRIGNVAFNGVSLKATADGSNTDLPFSIDLKAPGLIIDNKTLGDATLKLEGRHKPAGSQAQLRLGAEIGNERLTLTSTLQAQQQNWRAEDMNVTWGPLGFSGSIMGQGSDFQSVEASLKIRSDNKAAHKFPAISGFLDFEDQAVNGKITLTDLKLSNTNLAKTNISFSGTRNDATLDIASNGSSTIAGITHPVSFKTISNINLEALSSQTTVTGMLAAYPLKTKRPIAFSRSDKQTKLNGVLTFLQGAIDFTYHQSQPNAELDLGWSHISLQQVGHLVTRSVSSGVSSGYLKLQNNKTLTGTIEIDVKEFSTQSTKKLQSAFLLSSELSDNLLVASLTSADGSALQVNGNVTLPYNTVDRALIPKFSSQAVIDASLDSKGPIESVWALIGSSQTLLSGDHHINLTVNNSLSNLKPVGEISLIGGQLQDGQTGAHLKDINLRTKISDKHISISSLMAKGSRGGSVSGTGHYRFHGKSDAVLKLNGLEMFDRDDMNAKVSGSLSVIRDMENIGLNGALTIDQARINIDQLPTGGYVTLDVQFEDEQTTDKIEPVSSLPINLDIFITSPRRIFLSGQGLDTEWNADLHLSGPMHDLVLKGQSNIVRGDMNVLNKEFVFGQSQISFDGSLREAVLDITAERDEEDLTAVIQVTGNVQKPSLRLTSEPSLPQDEVLSWVLFGSSPNQLSAFQAAQLAAAIASLSSSQSLGLVNKLQESLNVDRLDFGTAEDGNAAVRTGKYISDDVYLELQSGITGATGVDVEWTPRENIEVGTELKAEEPPRFTIKWKRDYDFGETGDESDTFEKGAK